MHTSHCGSPRNLISHYVVLAKVENVTPALPSVSFEQPVVTFVNGIVRHRFSGFALEDVVPASAVFPFCTIDELMVLAPLIWVSEGILESHAIPVPFAEFVHEASILKTGAEPPRKRKKDQVATEQNLEEFPWLHAYLSKNHVGGAVDCPDPPHPPVQQADDVSDELLDEALAKLAEKREEWAASVEQNAHFITQLRGGKWLRQQRGLAYDSYVGQAASAAVKQWCRQHKLPLMGTYSIAKFGEEVASTLALEWTRRMEYVHAFLQTSDVPLAQTYIETQEFKQFVDGLPANSPALPRIRELRSLSDRICPQHSASSAS